MDGYRTIEAPARDEFIERRSRFIGHIAPVATDEVAVFVTRYLGGILWGAGGRVRAYAQGAKTAIDAARVLNMQPAALVELDMGYDFYGKATYILPQYEVQVTDSRFEEGVRLQLLCKTSRLAALTHQLRELSSGTVAPVILEERFAHFPEGGPA